MDIINKCNELQNNYILILWTCRQGTDLDIALKELEKVELKFEYVNENPKWTIDQWDNDSRKIGATWYLDDKNISFENFLKL